METRRRGVDRRSATVAIVIALASAALTTIWNVATPTADAADVATVDCGTFPERGEVGADRMASFSPLDPLRIVDTRDGTGGVRGEVDAGCVLRIDTESIPVAADAGALALSVTALGQQPGYQQVFPCDDGRATTSNVNNRPGGVPTPNLVVGQPDDGGDICIFTFVTAHLIVDVTGSWSADGDTRFRAVDPVRVDDTRTTPGRAPGDLAPHQIDLVPHVPPGTSAIVANLTVTQPTGDGYLVIYPCDTSPPLASNLNFLAGEDRAVSVIVGIDVNRQVCTASNVAHHVVLDVTGYYEPTPQFGPSAELRPEPGTRLVDSRDGTGGWTTPLRSGERRILDVGAAIPDRSQATGVLLNVTVTGQQDVGYVTVTSCGVENPETSSVNYAPGVDASNLVVVDLGSSTQVCVFSLHGAHVVIDLYGVLRAGSDEVLAERIDPGGHTWPPYRTDAPDYVTECTDPLPVDLDLLPGTSARINGVSVASGTTMVDLDRADELVRLELRRGAVTQRHWIRCVPDDFRRAEVVVRGDPAPGWYLLNVPAANGDPDRVVILDEFGAPVWHQLTPTPLALFERAADGNLLGLPTRHFGLSADPDRGAVKTRLDGSLIQEYVAVDAPGPGPGAIDENPTDHHDIVELPGGGVTLVSYPLVEDVDLTLLGPGFGTNETIDDGLIQELDDDGALVWEWRMSDHFAFEPGTGSSTLVATHDEIGYPVRWSVDQGHPGVEDVDVFHINSVERVDDGTGDYIVSARHIDAVFRIERATGNVAWILRSADITAPPKSGTGALLTIVGDPLGGPRRAHDAILSGDLLTLLDNRVDTGQPTRAVTYRIDTTGPGAGTATLVASRTEPGGATSFGLGSQRPGPDGHTIVNWGSGIQPVFQQFDTAGEETMRFTLPDGGSTFRVVWYPPDAFDRAELRRTTGRTMQIPS